MNRTKIDEEMLSTISDPTADTPPCIKTKEVAKIHVLDEDRNESLSYEYKKFKKYLLTKCEDGFFKPSLDEQRKKCRTVRDDEASKDIVGYERDTCAEELRKAEDAIRECVKKRGVSEDILQQNDVLKCTFNDTIVCLHKVARALLGLYK